MIFRTAYKVSAATFLVAEARTTEPYITLAASKPTERE